MCYCEVCLTLYDKQIRDICGCESWYCVGWNAWRLHYLVCMVSTVHQSSTEDQ
jgi:hypothetical protein